MDKQIGIYRGNIFYGFLGEETGVKSKCDNYGLSANIKVGDLVAFYYMEQIFVGVVMKRNGTYGIMGHGVKSLDYEKMTRISSYRSLTKETINLIHKGNFELRETTPQEMTIEQIEKELGKRIKIIGD